MNYGGWEVPPEVIDPLCLLITASDGTNRWRAGLIRVKRPYLRARTNRDAKRQLTAASRSHIRILWPDNGRLPENLFLNIDTHIRERIFNARANRGSHHGWARTNELFRLVQKRIIRRAELATVAQQDDFMKRARGNGGARTQLRSDGILVLGHQDNDPKIAVALGLPLPKRGQFISARVAPAQEDRDDPIAIIDGSNWALAREDDPVIATPLILKDRRLGSGYGSLSGWHRK
jgi:hypothetical protein